MRSNNAFTHDIKEKAAQQLELVKGKVIEGSKEVGKKIDGDVHRRPWHYLGIAAFFSMFFGFFVGRKSK
jgi:ElaB/YqjD/DUF883 family membrane-anchored ribosome-binding protein